MAATKIKLTKDQKAEIQAGALLGNIDPGLEPHVLTDKDETKVCGCRTCKRPCVVTHFASAAKTACNDHRGRAAPTPEMREFDRTKETHILTEKDKTKELPCRNCGRPCVVNFFAAPAKVACNDCRKRVPTPRKTTSYEKKDGRYRKITKTDSPADLRWSEWALHSPMDVKDIRLPEEQEELDKVRIEANEAGAAALKARREREIKDDELLVASGRKIVGEGDKEKERRKTLKNEIKQLESDITTLDGLEVQQRDLQQIKRNRAATLTRIGFIRGALAVRYALTNNGHDRTLSRGEFNLHVPNGYLTEDEFKQAEKKNP